MAQQGARFVRNEEVTGASPVGSTHGVVAQQGERRDGIAKARGAIPLDSTLESEPDERAGAVLKAERTAFERLGCETSSLRRSRFVYLAPESAFRVESRSSSPNHMGT